MKVKAVINFFVLNLYLVAGRLELKVKQHPNQSQYAVGDTVNFTCSADNIPSFNFNWYIVRGNTHTFYNNTAMSRYNVSCVDANTRLYCIIWSLKKETTRYAIFSEDITINVLTNTKCKPQSPRLKEISLIASIYDISYRIGESVEFTCTTKEKSVTKMEIYQIKGNRQNLVNSTKSKELIITKTISISDQNSVIYCAVFGYNEDFGSSDPIRIFVKKNEANSNSNEELDVEVKSSTSDDEPKDDFILHTTPPTTTPTISLTIESRVSEVPYNNTLMIAGAVAVIILIFVASGAFCYRRRAKTPPQSSGAKVNYVPDTVHYAELQITQTRAQRLPYKEETPYAQIVGVLKPRK